MNDEKVLLALIKELKAAKRSSREFDAEIMDQWSASPLVDVKRVPHFTSSIDAAVTLGNLPHAEADCKQSDVLRVIGAALEHGQTMSQACMKGCARALEGVHEDLWHRKHFKKVKNK